MSSFQKTIKIYQQNDLKDRASETQIQILINCCICDHNVNNNKIVRIGTCNHIICCDCAKKYVEQKIRNYQDIICFQQHCQQKIYVEDVQDGSNCKYLTYYQYINIQEKKKIKKYIDNLQQMKRRKQNQKKCEDCIKIAPKKCEKCQMAEVQLPENMKYCPNCKNIIQKAKGCNHLKCICGFEFCFQCLEKWSISHICQFRIPKRSGLSFVGFLIIKMLIGIVMFGILVPIALFLLVAICGVSSFLLGFYLYFQFFEWMKNQNVNKNLVAFIFLLSLGLLPAIFVLFLVPGFFLPFVNVCYKQRLFLDPNILPQLITIIFMCFVILRLI